MGCFGTVNLLGQKQNLVEKWPEKVDVRRKRRMTTNLNGMWQHMDALQEGLGWLDFSRWRMLDLVWRWVLHNTHENKDSHCRMLGYLSYSSGKCMVTIFSFLTSLVNVQWVIAHEVSDIMWETKTRKRKLREAQLGYSLKPLGLNSECTSANTGKKLFWLPNYRKESI